MTAAVGMFAPGLFKGKAQIKSLAADSTGTARSYTLDTVTSLTVGDHAFVGSSAGPYAIPEYLGLIRTINTGTKVVTVELAALNRTSGDKFWTATSAWRPVSVPSHNGLSQEPDGGLERLEGTTAAPLLTQVKDPGETVRIKFEMNAATDWALFLTFWDSVTGKGLGSFTAAWRDLDRGGVHRVAKCRFADADQARRANARVNLYRDFEVALAIVTDGLYY
jgi:hypothetical protein